MLCLFIVLFFFYYHSVKLPCNLFFFCCVYLLFCFFFSIVIQISILVEYWLWLCFIAFSQFFFWEGEGLLPLKKWLDCTSFIMITVNVHFPHIRQVYYQHIGEYSNQLEQRIVYGCMEAVLLYAGEIWAVNR